MSTRQKGKHLTYADRKYIEKMYKLKPKGEICEHLTLNYHTLERELMRCEGEYNAKEAQEDADIRNMRRRLNLKEKCENRKAPIKESELSKKRVEICLGLKSNITPEEIVKVTGMSFQLVNQYYKSLQKKE